MRLFTLYLTLLICPLSWSQFTVIPTGTTATIGELALHSDTLLISAHPNYFAKYMINEDVLVSMDAPGLTNYGNTNLQVVNDYYYILSSQGIPYDHNFILKSTNGGITWDTLADLPGLYYTMTLIDTTFGILAGGFGSHAITNGSDNNWIMQDSLTGTISASTAFGDSTIMMTSLLNLCYLTQDRGQTWIEISGAPSTMVNQIQFLNQDTIYLITNLGTSNHTSYLKSTYNQGGAWSIFDFSYEYHLTSDYEFYSEVKDMQMNQDGTGYILAHLEKTVYNWSSTVVDKMSIFYTDDFGETWTPFVTEFSELMYDFVFLNDSTVFIGGENGLLLKWDLTIPISNVLTEGENFEILPLVKFFPNPVSSMATLTVDENHLPCMLTIINQLGQVVHTESISSATTSISFESLPNGVYYYSVGENRGQFSISR